MIQKNLLPHPKTDLCTKRTFYKNKAKALNVQFTGIFDPIRLFGNANNTCRAGI